MVDAAVKNIFKSYDIRGKVGSELTAEIAEAVGRAQADWLPAQGTVAVGRDMRPDSAELANALIAGLRAQGRDVWDIGEVTSDMIYFAVGHFDLAGGAMITASHNPGEYNGIKLCREEARPIGEDSGLFDIRDAALGRNFKPAAAKGQITQKDITEDWIEHVLSFIDVNGLKPLHIAVDAGNGMAGKIFPELEPYVPFEVEEMYFELDGTFPNHEANPLKFETLNDMISLIKSKKLDGGVAFDGDGDRAFLVDETGTVLTGSIMMGLMGEYFLAKNSGGSIIYDLRSSHAVPEIIAENGGKAVVTKVGHTNIKKAMRENNAPFGGESSGHFYFRDNWYADSGLIGAVIALYAASKSGLTLSQIRKKYTRYACIPETNFTVSDKQAALERLTQEFKNQKLDYLDGVTVDFGNGSWFNVRASNTEPVMRLNAEAKSQAQLEQMVSKVTSLITKR